MASPSAPRPSLVPSGSRGDWGSLGTSSGLRVTGPKPTENSGRIGTKRGLGDHRGIGQTTRARPHWVSLCRREGTRLRVTTVYLPPYGDRVRLAMLGKRLDSGNDIMVFRPEKCKLLSDLVTLDFVIQVGWARKVNR